MSRSIFPPYLNAGSEGAAVDTLHILLFAMGYGKEIVRDAEYGDITVEAVKSLQADLGFVESDVDGNFGPKTRMALKAQRGIDADAILPSRDGIGFITHYIAPNGDGQPEVYNPFEEADADGDDGVGNA